MALPTMWEARNHITTKTRERIPLTLAKRAFSLTAVEKHKGDRQTNAQGQEALVHILQGFRRPWMSNIGLSWKFGTSIQPQTPWDSEIFGEGHSCLCLIKY